MTDVAIRADKLSKRYKIGARQNRHDTLRDQVVNSMKSLFSRNGHGASRETRSSMASAQASDSAGPRSSSINHSDYIWALKDVSFEVKHGEVVGFIGRNGAGKSTLLKILSRITQPTTGRAEIYGRVVSLLEVGTGFHPELTGRENIYLNGAILGMKKWEIATKFDEIVAFSEIEKFIDTPVKRYSSGMYVRLAFAVAAHLEPEILIVDEVLAVGDIAFQKKCLGKINQVARDGRTVLLVTHNTDSAATLCNRAVLLKAGHVVLSGPSGQVISQYLAEIMQKEKDKAFRNCERTGNGKILIRSFHLESPNGQVLDTAKTGSPAVFVFGFENCLCQPTDKISLGFSIHDKHGYGLLNYYSHFSGVSYENLPAKGHFKCLLPELPLAAGQYNLMCRAVSISDETIIQEVDWPHVFVPISVTNGDFFGTGVHLASEGPMLIKGEWSMGVLADQPAIETAVSGFV